VAIKALFLKQLERLLRLEQSPQEAPLLALEHLRAPIVTLARQPAKVIRVHQSQVVAPRKSPLNPNPDIPRDQNLHPTKVKARVRRQRKVRRNRLAQKARHAIKLRVLTIPVRFRALQAQASRSQARGQDGVLL